MTTFIRSKAQKTPMDERTWRADLIFSCHEKKKDNAKKKETKLKQAGTLLFTLMPRV